MIIISMKCGGVDVPITQTTSDPEGPLIHPASKLLSINKNEPPRDR